MGTMSKRHGKPGRTSFSALIRPHLEPMYRLAYRLTGHREDAQDLVQDVLLKLHDKAEQLAEVEAVASWLKRVVYNQYVDHQRRFARQRLRLVEHRELSANPDRAAAVQATPEEQAAGEFTISRLQEALSRLSDDHRLIINLHDVEGYTLTEISEITGITLGTLKSRRQRARARLQNILDEGPESPELTSRQGGGEDTDALRPVSAKCGALS